MCVQGLVLSGVVAVCVAAPGGLYHEGGYHGPHAIPHVLPDGHLADTHEVAAAKAEHFSAVAKAAAHSGHGHGGYGGYGGAGAAYSDGYAGAYSHDDHADARYSKGYSQGLSKEVGQTPQAHV